MRTNYNGLIWFWVCVATSLLLVVLLLSSCSKASTCWTCERGHVGGVQYSDTTVCQEEMPVLTDANGQLTSKKCYK